MLITSVKKLSTSSRYKYMVLTVQFNQRTKYYSKKKKNQLSFQAIHLICGFSFSAQFQE
jgi:hypothetical protein